MRTALEQHSRARLGLHDWRYQVIKKWLSYREHKLLGRPLTTDETSEVMNIARRIAAILLLEPALDADYQIIKNSTYPWQTFRETLTGRSQKQLQPKG